MKLVAMMVVRNEADRYLSPCLEHLLDFCDEVRVLDDASTDNTVAICHRDGVQTLANPRHQFFEHEGMTRQTLLEWTMQAQPTHILAIDADEFVADGALLRETIEPGAFTGVWKLAMTEIWEANPDGWLHVRTDGDWKPRPIGICFAVPPDNHTNRQHRRHWRIPDRALACGRVPMLTQMAGNRTTSEAVTEILHFGWANKADRQARYDRYATHDGGRFHASKHLDSIMWDDDRVHTAAAPWPQTLPCKWEILARANRS